MRMFLVSDFFPDMTQQIHSLWASGVISSHIACTDVTEAMDFRKSAGRICTAAFLRPPEALRERGLDINLFYYLKADNCGGGSPPRAGRDSPDSNLRQKFSYHRKGGLKIAEAEGFEPSNRFPG